MNDDLHETEVLREAREEFRMDGVLSTSTYIRLTNAGYNADVVVARFTNDPEIN